MHSRLFEGVLCSLHRGRPWSEKGSKFSAGSSKSALPMRSTVAKGCTWCSVCNLPCKKVGQVAARPVLLYRQQETGAPRCYASAQQLSQGCLRVSLWALQTVESLYLSEGLPALLQDMAHLLC